ncbi:MAG: cyclic nucleotide-binding domain-containing protein [Ignavibacteriaceae bacterium]
MKQEAALPVHSSFWSNFFKKKTELPLLLSILKEMPPFNELKKSELDEILRIVHERNYVAGEYIFLQDDPGIGLYFLLEGEVSIYRESLTKLKVKLANFSMGDFFGELALIDRGNRSASAIADTNCKLGIIFKPDLEEVIKKKPKIGVAVLSGLAKIIITRLRNLNEEYISLLEERITKKEELHGTSI